MVKRCYHCRGMLKPISVPSYALRQFKRGPYPLPYNKEVCQIIRTKLLSKGFVVLLWSLFPTVSWVAPIESEDQLRPDNPFYWCGRWGRSSCIIPAKISVCWVRTSWRSRRSLGAHAAAGFPAVFLNSYRHAMPIPAQAQHFWIWSETSTACHSACGRTRQRGRHS